MSLQQLNDFTEIFVCHAGACVARGAEAVLTEIEELVKEVGGKCVVNPSGCLGLCNQAPNAVTFKRDTDGNARGIREHVQLRSLEASAKLVELATGKQPNLNDTATQKRLEGVRAIRRRQHAIRVAKWNAALRGLAEEAKMQPALRVELIDLLKKAGFPEGIGNGVLAENAVIENYSRWSVDSVTAVTRHSALQGHTVGCRHEAVCCTLRVLLCGLHNRGNQCKNVS